MKKILLVIMAAFLFGCASNTQMVKSACPKVTGVPDLPKEEVIPEPKKLPPGKAYTPTINSVALSRSNWSLMDLYNKSLRLWANSTKEAIDKHNEMADTSIKEVVKETPWYRRIW